MSYRGYPSGPGSVQPSGPQFSPPPYTPPASLSFSSQIGPFYNPMVPFESTMPSLQDGSMILIEGAIPQDSSGFSINLKQGAGDGAGILLHVNPRFNENEVVRNSFIKGRWGKEERHGGFPLLKGQSFQCIIMAAFDYFKIALNGQHFQEYNHRVAMETATHLHIEGQVTLSLVRFQTAAVTPPGYSPTESPLSPHVVSFDQLSLADNSQRKSSSAKTSPANTSMLPTSMIPTYTGVLGKHFYISSALQRVAGLVLGVEGSYSFQGNQVVLCQRQRGPSDSQLWYEDQSTGTIRNKADKLCLDAAGDCVLVREYVQGRASQQLMVSQGRIQLRSDPTMVLGVDESRQRVAVALGSYCSEAFQHWNIQYLPPSYFYIRSKYNQKVADIKGENPRPGTEVVTWKQSWPPKDNQLWYEDPTGVIHSKLNNYTLDSSKNGFLRMMAYDPGNPKMQWVISGDRVHLRGQPNRVLDIRGMNPFGAASLIEYDSHGGKNQQWTIEYIKKS